MRDDMAKVIVERPRIRAYNARKGRAQPLDDLPKREGVRRGHEYRGDRKELNENLAPLCRYLEAQVGRPWDKVYSEITANLRVDNTVQQHVRGHLRDFVAVAPRRGLSDWRSSIHGGLWWQRLYVDPRTGLLCRTDRLAEEKARRRARLQRRAPAPDRIPLSDKLELRLIAAFWYEVELAPLPVPEYRVYLETQKTLRRPWDRTSGFFEAEMKVGRLVTPAVRDVVSGNLREAGPAIDDLEHWQIFRRKFPERHYAVAKRMLSHRELREHGLNNKPT